MFKKRQIKSKLLNLDSEDLPQDVVSKPKKIPRLEMIKPTIGCSSASQNKLAQQQAKQQMDQLNYKGTHTIQHNQDIAVMGNHIDTEPDQDARAKALQSIETTKNIKEGKLEKGIYRGNNAYANYNISQQIATNSKFKGNFGPLRAPTNIRVTSRMDHNPQLCKDWFDAGYCVFGNSCIYIHDRYDYKSGWELQRDFQKQQRERWRRINDPTYQQKPEYEEKLQKFKVEEECRFCNSKLVNPKTVSCGHIFCGKCAVELHQGKSKCVVCKKTLSGVMNNAEGDLAQKRNLYEQMKRNFESEAEKNKLQKKRWKNSNSQSVFQL